MHAPELAALYFDYSNQQDFGKIEAMLAPDIVYDSQNTGIYEGKAAVLAMMRAFFKAYRSIRWTPLQSTVIENTSDTVQILFVAEGTTSTGADFKRSGIETLAFKDGLISAITVRAASG